MEHHNAASLDFRYRQLLAFRAGFLPKDRAAVDSFLQRLKETVAERGRGGQPEVVSPTVVALRELFERDGIVRMLVDQMIREVPARHRTVEDIPELLATLDHITVTAPLFEEPDGSQNHFPMSSLFTYMMMTTAGEAAFRDQAFNDALRQILREWCFFLESENSLTVLNTTEAGWLSEAAYKANKLYEFVIPDRSAPHWGWTSFNAYFHRQIKAKCRPIADPENPKVVVSANDGSVYKIARKVKEEDRFWVKGQPYSLRDMLASSAYVDRFIGGDVFQTFLSGANYHRWRSPIAGTVQAAYVVEGLMFSNAESAGKDTTAGTYSQGYETSVNTRGLVFIESDDPKIGLVCVMPVGITEISSVTIQVRRGDRVEKGEELGFFSYGGSSMALVFQPGAIKKFTVPDNTSGDPDGGPTVDVNAEIAIAN